MNLTYEEIRAQYRSLAETKASLDRDMEKIIKFLRGGSFASLVVLGCGSSYSLACSMARMTNMQLGVPATALPAGDVLLHSPRYVKCFQNALVLAVSRSGSTSEILLAIDAMKAQGYSFTTASLCCRDDSKLSHTADAHLDFPWAFDNSVCQTRTVSCLYFSFAYILAHFAGDKQLIADFELVLANGEEYLERTDALTRELAPQDWNNVVVLADAEISGLAEEGALAFKEICQLPSNYYHLLDARHGPAVLIHPDTLILAAVGPNDHYEQDFLREMSKKTSHILAFTDSPLELDGVLTVNYGKPLSHTAKGLPFILICQLLSYHKAICRGTDPDAPTGLDAWISL